MAASSWMTCVGSWAGGWRWSSAPTRHRAAPSHRPMILLVLRRLARFWTSFQTVC